MTSFQFLHMDNNNSNLILGQSDNHPNNNNIIESFPLQNSHASEAEDSGVSCCSSSPSSPAYPVSSPKEDIDEKLFQQNINNNQQGNELVLIDYQPLNIAACQCVLCKEGHTLNLTWKDMVFTVMKALSALHSKQYYQMRMEILPFMDAHWKRMWAREKAGNWQSSVGMVLSKYPTLFKSGSEKMHGAGYWGLCDNHYHDALHNLSLSSIVQTGLPRAPKRKRSLPGGDNSSSASSPATSPNRDKAIMKKKTRKSISLPNIPMVHPESAGEEEGGDFFPPNSFYHYNNNHNDININNDDNNNNDNNNNNNNNRNPMFFFSPITTTTTTTTTDSNPLFALACVSAELTGVQEQVVPFIPGQQSSSSNSQQRRRRSISSIAEETTVKIQTAPPSTTDPGRDVTSSFSTASPPTILYSFREHIEKLKGEVEVMRKRVALEDQEYQKLELLRQQMESKEQVFQTRIQQIMESTSVLDRSLKETVENLTKQVEEQKKKQVVAATTANTDNSIGATPCSV